MLAKYVSFNTLRPRQNGRHFPDDIFKCIFLNENVWISLKISLNFVPKGPINNSQALVQIMAWRRPGDKPLSKPMMIILPTNICVARPQLVNRCYAGLIWRKLEIYLHFMVFINIGEVMRVLTTKKISKKSGFSRNCVIQWHLRSQSQFEYHLTWVMINQDGFGAAKQQAISWTNVNQVPWHA